MCIYDTAKSKQPTSDNQLAEGVEEGLKNLGTTLKYGCRDVNNISDCMNSRRDIQGLTIKQTPLPFLHMLMLEIYYSTCKKLLRLYQPKEVSPFPI